MAAIDLNTVRATIEARVATELASSPVIPVVFHNMPFDSSNRSYYVCTMPYNIWRKDEYLTQGNAKRATNSMLSVLL